MESELEAELEQKIIAIWSEVLQLPYSEIRHDMHLLLQGGDSLHQARIVSRVEKELGVVLGLDELSRYSTPRLMSELCGRRLMRSRHCEAVPVALEAGQATGGCALKYPATPTQQGLWYAELLSGKRSLYRSGLRLELKGQLDRKALEAAVRDLLQRFVVLRSVFSINPGDRRLWADISAVPQTVLLYEDNSEQASGSVAEDKRMQMLHQGMFGACLYRLGPRHHSLLLLSHHLCCDGWSGHVLLDRLLSVYRRAHSGEAIAEPPAADHAFIDRALRMYQLPADSPERQRRLDWWCETLNGYADCGQWLWAAAVKEAGDCENDDSCPERNSGRTPVSCRGLSSQQPGSSPAAEAFPHQLCVGTFSLPEAAVLRVRDRAAKLQLSVFVPMLAAFMQALQQQGAGHRQVIGIPQSIRQADEENSVGCFMELLPFAFTLQPDEPGAELLARLDAEFSAARARHLSLPELAAWLKPVPLPDGNPWFSILFLFQNFPVTDVKLDGLELEITAQQPDETQYALKFEVLPRGKRWHVRIEYAQQLFDRSRIESLWRLFIQFLPAASA